MIQKIISGGQTGADRAALDFAIKHDIPYGGWVPKGRKTEDGTLPEKYHLQEMPTVQYSKRTEQNILDSDGTLIVSHGLLTGGSALTRESAKQYKKPWIHIDLKATSSTASARMIREWIGRKKIKIINIAGPRASKDPMIYQAVTELLGEMKKVQASINNLNEIKASTIGLLARIKSDDSVDIQAAMKEYSTLVDRFYQVEENLAPNQHRAAKTDFEYFIRLLNLAIASYS